MAAERVVSAETQKRRGELWVFYGPMFSGKSDELIVEIGRQEHVGKNALLVKPSNDNRYSEEEVVSHSGRRLNAHRIDKTAPEQVFDLLRHLDQIDENHINIVAFDEGQFFDKEKFPEVIDRLLEQGYNVLVAGLATDSDDNPFGAIPTLIARAEYPIHKTALCTYILEEGNKCGARATKTQRLVEGGGQELVGGSESYAAHCSGHHTKGNIDATEN